MSLCKDVMKLNSRCRYEELRYWYDCLCYEEDLRQYNDYIVEYRKWEEENLHTDEVCHGQIYLINIANEFSVFLSLSDLLLDYLFGIHI